MRDPNRLDNFYTELCQIHKEYFPDWSLVSYVQTFLVGLQAQRR